MKGKNDDPVLHKIFEKFVLPLFSDKSKVDSEALSVFFNNDSVTIQEFKLKRGIKYVPGRMTYGRKGKMSFPKSWSVFVRYDKSNPKAVDVNFFSSFNDDDEWQYRMSPNDYREHIVEHLERVKD